MLTRGYTYYIKLSKNMVLNPKDGFSYYTVGAGVFVFSKVKTVLVFFKKCLTKFLKLSIIKLGIVSRKGDKHGKKSGISNEISQ